MMPLHQIRTEAALTTPSAVARLITMILRTSAARRSAFLALRIRLGALVRARVAGCRIGLSPLEDIRLASIDVVSWRFPNTFAQRKVGPPTKEFVK